MNPVANKLSPAKPIRKHAVSVFKAESSYGWCDNAKKSRPNGIIFLKNLKRSEMLQRMKILYFSV